MLGNYLNKIKPHLIYDKIYGNIDISYIKFLCDILSTLKREGSIAYITLRQSPEELKSGLNEKLEDFVNYARALKGVKVAMLFRRISKKKIKVSLRSKGDFDVNNLAGKFGGGGHRSASGCVIEGDIEEVKKKVLKVAKVLVNK